MKRVKLLNEIYWIIELFDKNSVLYADFTVCPLSSKSSRNGLSKVV
jgi:hypothetical protein